MQSVTLKFVKNNDRKIIEVEIKRNIIEQVDINSDMSVLYDFNSELKQSSSLAQQEEKIYKLMKTYPIINEFVLS